MAAAAAAAEEEVVAAAAAAVVWRVVCFWPCVLSVCCVSAVSQGNAWLPIQAGADPAVPS